MSAATSLSPAPQTIKAPVRPLQPIPRPSDTKVSARMLKVAARDGHPLAVTVFEPANREAERVVIVAAATAVKRGFYEPYARYLASQGCAVITFDYRGIGGSLEGPVSKSKATIQDWGKKDYPAIIDWAKDSWPTLKLGIVGHSVGGQLVGVLDNVNKVDAVCTVAAQNGFYRLYPWREAVSYGLLWHVMPLIATVCSFFPAKRLKLGEDLPKGVALEWARFCRNRDYMIAEDGTPLRDGFKSYEGPVLAYSLEDDVRAPRVCVSSLHSFYDKAFVEHRHVDPRDFGASAGRIGHVGFFFAKQKHTLWRESLDWLRSMSG